MKYIQIILLFTYGMICFTVLGVTVCAPLWFLGAKSPFELLIMLNTSVMEAIKELNK